MTNNLKRIEKELRTFAKRCRDVKYNSALLFTFLLTGLISFTAPETDSVEQARRGLQTSITDMKKLFKEAKAENNKLLKSSNLELIQLMEQGDHVVKSPWSSWQFGMNYFYSDWRGTYKGRGDKKEKYPYEGIFQRDENEFNRYVSPDSKFYNSLGRSSNLRLASSNLRDGLNSQYGIASTQPVPEPIVDLELSAGIRPKVVNKVDLNLAPKAANIPTLPTAISFAPISPNVVIPKDPSLPQPPTFAVVLGADCNEGCESSSGTPRQTTSGGFLGNTALNKSAQNITTWLHYTWPYNSLAEQSYAFKMYKETDTTSLPNPDTGDPNKYYFNSYNFGNEFPTPVVNSQGTDKNHQPFFIGGSRFWEIDNYTGTGTFEIPTGKTVYLGGILTLGMVSQENGATLKNSGTITDSEEKNDQFIRSLASSLTIQGPTTPYTIKKSEDGYVGYKVGIAQVEENSRHGWNGSPRWAKWENQKLENAGTIDFRGERSIGMYIYLPKQSSSYDTDRTFAKMTNSGKIFLSGKESYGMKLAAKSDDTATMINDTTGMIELRKNPDAGAKDKADNSAGMALMADSSVSNGVSLKKGNAVNKGTIKVTDVKDSLGAYVNINSDITNEGTIEVNSTIDKAATGTAQSVNIGMRSDNLNGGSTSSEVINKDDGTVHGKITIDGNYAIGMLTSNSKLTNTGTISSTDVKNGVGIAGINSATVQNNGVVKVLGTGDTNNIGIFLNTNSTGTAPSGGALTQSVEVSGNNSTGVLVSGGSSLTMGGTVKATGNAVTGVVANNTTITLNGTGGVTVNNGTSAAGKATIKVAGPTPGSEVDAEKGSYGIVVKGSSGNFTGTDTTVTANVTTDKSVGLYSEGILKVKQADITTSDGAINFYAKGGSIEVTNGGTTETGQKSLLFYTSNNGTIKLSGGTLNATIKGGTDPSNRGTAFYYEAPGATYGTFDDTAITNYAATTFGGTLGNLRLNMEAGSRLFVASNVSMNLSNTNPTGISTALGLGGLTGSNYKTFMLYLSELVVNHAVDLNDPNSAYNQLEIANSSIKNADTITGTNNRQVAMAQENGMDTSGITGYQASKVTLTNTATGTITLSGDESTGMYAKRGLIYNDGTISVGKKSTAIYLVDDGLGPVGTQGAGVSNNGTITLGEDSTGIYYKNGTSTLSGGISNGGKIESSANNVIAMTFDSDANTGSKKFENEANGIVNLTGDKSTAMYATGNGSYTAKNSGAINLSSSSDINNPNVGMFTDKAPITLESDGTINAGDKTVGLYGYSAKLGGSSVTTVGQGSTGIYSKGGNVTLDAGSKLNIGTNDAVGVYYVGDGGTITSNAGDMTIGDSSYGFVIKNTGSIGNNLTTSASTNVTMGNDTVYVYNNGAGNIVNNTNLTSTGNENYGVYSAGNVTNNGTINFGTGLGNVGIYSISGGTAVNNAPITIGDSDPGNSKFGIGMAAGYETSDTGNIVNNSVINVNGKSSIGMYATGATSTIHNTSGGVINLSGNGSMGMYLDNGAKGINDGIIQTVGSPQGAVGVVVRKGSILTNNGTININSSGGYATFIVSGGIIRNHGTITVSGGAKEEYKPGNKPTGKGVAGVDIHAPAGAEKATITLHGVPVTPVTITNSIGQREPLTSSIGMYIDTLRGTNPIGGLNTLGGTEADLIIGAEAAGTTRSKYIEVSGDIIKPYNDAIAANPQITKWNIYSGSATWIATATMDANTGTIKNVYLAKKPYTAFSGNEATPVEPKDTYNFTDGLEQRYGVEEVGTREKQLFDKLSSIGSNEEIMVFQAIDEMMGHQYANVQQRTYGTGRLIDKEITHLSKEWDTKSKQSNKIKAFGMRDEYKTDTAGIIDYTSNAYGFAYLHEDETVKLGNSSGWYAGAVHNRIKFKDIGKSKENQTMLKLGIFRTFSPAADHNGNLQWTISGEGYISRNDMHRKYLVVDEIFNAKSDYNTYGVAVKNELGYNIRTSERTSIRPYGSLKLEYGRFSTIKEKSGEMRLEIEGNDYYSIKPEVGIEFKYRQPMAVKTTFVTTLGLGYENELGKVGNVKNKGRVSYTNADWFNIRGEKDDRKGNFKADLNIGIENQRFGVTLNGGYDTKGKNVRGGIGFRIIY